MPWSTLDRALLKRGSVTNGPWSWATAMAVVVPGALREVKAGVVGVLTRKDTAVGGFPPTNTRDRVSMTTGASCMPATMPVVAQVRPPSVDLYSCADGAGAAPGEPCWNA